VKLITAKNLSTVPASPKNRADKVRAELARKIAQSIGPSESLATGVPGLTLYRRTKPTAPASSTSEPSVALVVQGRKRVDLGATTFFYGQSQFLLTSVDLPVISRIVEASEESPYLCLRLKLDMTMVREVLSQEEMQVSSIPSNKPAMITAEATIELLDAFSRLVDLMDRPQEVSFLSPLIQREIVYRILRSAEGQRLRAITTLGDQSQRTAKAITWIRANYAKPVRVEDLAQIAGMGVSTLHHHFRVLTSMSPLRYQKQLRLHVARQRMLIDGVDATSAAFEVGYESASQFNREYSRLFGQPPLRDVRTLRSPGAPGMELPSDQGAVATAAAR
jgi:AraC-like DNA-binding protein